MSKKVVSILCILALLVSIAALGLGVTYPVPASDDIVALGTTHLSGLSVSGNETDELIVDQTSTGDIVEFRDNGTVVWRIADGGATGFANGTAAAPSIAFASDSDTGIYRVGADNLGLATGGSLRADVSSSGLDMNNLPVINIGVAGTDFSTAGALTLDEILTVNDQAVIDNDADVIALRIQGHTTQTSNPNLLVVEQSGGTDVFYATNAGAVYAAGAVDFASTLEVVGASEFTGTATFYGDVSVDDTLNLDETAYTTTGTHTLTPTTTLYELNPSAVATITLDTGSAAKGDLLILVNISANNVVIADSNILTSDGSAVTLGQYDVIVFVYVGSAWYEVSRSANS